MKRFSNIPLAALAISIPVQAMADPNSYSGSMGYGMGYGGWFFGPLMMILFFGLIIAAVIGALRLLGLGSSPEGNRALDILAERYASGEIDEAEYASRKKALKS